MSTIETPVGGVIPIEVDSDEELQETLFVKRGCCFWMPCIGSKYDRVDEKDDDLRRRHWWYKGIDAFKKVREWSELVAGPKWKTFIRRFNKHRPAKQGKFQYDPLSYSLNFDDGNHGGGQNGNFNDDDEDRVFRDFSSRFASIPMSAKSSMDLGKETFT